MSTPEYREWAIEGHSHRIRFREYLDERDRHLAVSIGSYPDPTWYFFDKNDMADFGAQAVRLGLGREPFLPHDLPPQFVDPTNS